MKRLITAAGLFACAAWPAAALAQTSIGSPNSGLPTAPARTRVPDFAPPAVPGAGNNARLSTSLPIPQTQTGDPTTELFTAVNGGDYNAAEDAVSRGADINARNAFGETPLDLSIALNRNPITFMLLSARNEGGGAGPQAAALAPNEAPVRKSSKIHAIPARIDPRPMAAPPPTPGNDPGTPNPASGFLGFGPSR